MRFVFIPFSFAEFLAVDRTKTPVKAYLVLYARMAHQGVFVDNG
jgi:hypothetical protein